ncbi:MAG: transposase [Dolichospermum sp. WA123]|nr:transposase [Dolichospermum sp. WA123]
MPYNSNIHHRRSIRLKVYDYTQQGAYFVTICTHQRNCLFGEIVDGEIKLNTNGEIARGSWLSIPRYFKNVELDEFVIMPNHLHGIIIIDSSEVVGEALANQDFSQLFSEVAGEALANQDFSQSFSEVAGEALANQDFSQQQNLSSQCFAPTVYTGETIKINGTKPQSLAAITQNYKSVSTRQINRMNKAKGNVIWQRNYYEHIIRNEEALNNIREYIVNNPINWVKDQENPANFQTMQLLSNKNPIIFI